MSKYAPEVEEYVQAIVYAYLDSLRKSQQVEDRYHELPVEVKLATTRELREIANRTAEYLFENTNGLAELSNVESDTFMRSAIKSALSE